MSIASIAGFTNLGYHLHARKFDPIEADMRGRTVLVTGATGGLGLETATTLAELGARVIIVGRSAAKLESAQGPGGGRFVLERADLSLLEEVRRLADRIVHREDHIDVLVNNVGVLLPEREVTGEGLEKTFATDLAGQFLLTNLLLPALARSGSARVVTVSSGGMYSARIDPDDLQFEKRPYTGTAAYASAKRGQVILTELWAERFPGNEVVFHAMHPGWVNTQGVAGSLPTFNKLMKPFLRTPAQGADTMVWLSVAEPPGLRSGGFWFDRSQVPTHLTDKTRETPEDRGRLWKRLVDLTDSDVEPV